MSSKTIVCAACNAAVPYGRLSCPSCGELLASVAGAARPMVGAAVAMRATRAPRAQRATPSVLVDVPSAGAAGALAPATVARPSSADATGWDTPEPDDDWVADKDFDEPLSARSEPEQHEPDMAGARMAGAQMAEARMAGAQMAGAEMAGVAGAEMAGMAGAEMAGSAIVEPQMADVERTATQATDLDAPADDDPQWPESRPATPSATAVASPFAADAPGAYVPPIVPATPAGPPALARAWAGHPTADESALDTGTSARASAAALMDGARLPEFIGWLAVAGSAMAAVGFMLPWGISVIGAAGVDYFDRWGLAGRFHPLVVLALLAVLGLALVRNPIPLWVRVGLPGLGLGALLVGLIWPYLVGLPGMGPGVLVVAIGAIILAVAGIAALAVDRHAAEDRAV